MIITMLIPKTNKVLVHFASRSVSCMEEALYYCSSPIVFEGGKAYRQGAQNNVVSAPLLDNVFGCGDTADNSVCSLLDKDIKVKT